MPPVDASPYVERIADNAVQNYGLMSDTSDVITNSAINTQVTLNENADARKTVTLAAEENKNMKVIA